MIKDKAELQKFNDVKLPNFKGHIKITLKDAKTGHIDKVVEGENIVTNAVRDIMANNYLGAVDYSTLFPLWSKWYGGILCYANPHPTITVDNEEVLDPDNYYPQPNVINPLVAHAGQTAIDPTHDDILTRGNPQTTQYAYSENSIKQVWEWGTTHGNGTISALSLTHTDTGNAGLGNTGYYFKNSFTPLATIGVPSDAYTGVIGKDTLFTQYDDNHGLSYAIGEDGVYKAGNVKFQTNKITVYIAKMPYFKAGLYESLNADTEFVENFTVTTSITFYANPCYYFDYTNKRLWLFTNLTSTNVNYTSGWDKDTISYTVIDCVSKTEYSHGTITSDTEGIAPLGCAMTVTPHQGSKSVLYAIIKNGNYMYFPMSNLVALADGSVDYPEMNIRGYKKINISDQSDQATILFNDVQQYYAPPLFSGDLLVAPGRVVNGSTGYTCLGGPITSGTGNILDVSFSTYAFNQAQKVSSYLVECGRSADISSPRRIFANKMVNTTLFNLPAPVTKASSQSMIIEYTLTEVPANA